MKAKGVLKSAAVYRIMLAVFLICLVMLLYLALSKSGSVRTAHEMQPVHIIGTYSLDGGTPIPLTDNTVIDKDSLHTVVISGHFSGDIPNGMVLKLCLNNIHVSIRKNGAEIFRSGWIDTPSPFKTTGNTVDYYVSHGIKTGDVIEITLKNVYAGIASNVFGEFLQGLSYTTVTIFIPKAVCI